MYRWNENTDPRINGVVIDQSHYVYLMPGGWAN